MEASARFGNTIEKMASVLSLTKSIMVAIPIKSSELLASQTPSIPSSSPGNHE